MSVTQGFISERISVGYAKESAQGTPVTATLFVPTKSIDIVKKPNTIIVQAAAQTAASNRYAVPGIFDYSGPWVVPIFPDNGWSVIFAALGTDSISGAGPYVHTLAARTTGQLVPFTLEENIGGNNLDHQYAGCIVGKTTLKFAVNAEAEATHEVHAIKDATLASATAASWATDVPFSPTSVALSLGGTLDPTCVAFEMEIDNKPHAVPAFNATQFPQALVGTSREIKYKATVILLALNGGAGSAGYFADLAASGGLTVLDAVSCVVTQGTNVVTMGSAKCALTGYKEVMKMGALVMAELEFTAIANSASSFIDNTLVVTNSQAVAYNA